MLKRHRIVDPELLKAVRELPCFACLPFVKEPASDPHHLRARKSGGDDVAENVLPLCREHHDLIHRRGLSYMAKAFPLVKTWLDGAGWKYDSFFQRWRNPNVDRGEVIADGQSQEDRKEDHAQERHEEV